MHPLKRKICSGDNSFVAPCVSYACWTAPLTSVLEGLQVGGQPPLHGKILFQNKQTKQQNHHQKPGLLKKAFKRFSISCKKYKGIFLSSHTSPVSPGHLLNKHMVYPFCQRWLVSRLGLEVHESGFSNTMLSIPPPTHTPSEILKTRH